MAKQRIISKTYLTLALLLLAFIIISFVSFFEEKQTVDNAVIFILVMALLIFFVTGLLHFVDIFTTGEGNYLIEYFGKNLEIQHIFKIGKLPAFMRIGSTCYRIAWLSFINGDSKKKIKFFMIEDKGWSLIEDMKTKGISKAVV